MCARKNFAFELRRSSHLLASNFGLATCQVLLLPQMLLSRVELPEFILLVPDVTFAILIPQPPNDSASRSKHDNGDLRVEFTVAYHRILSD